MGINSLVSHCFCGKEHSSVRLFRHCFSLFWWRAYTRCLGEPTPFPPQFHAYLLGVLIYCRTSQMTGNRMYNFLFQMIEKRKIRVFLMLLSWLLFLHATTVKEWHDGKWHKLHCLRTFASQTVQENKRLKFENTLGIKRIETLKEKSYPFALKCDAKPVPCRVLSLIFDTIVFRQTPFN